MLFSKKGNKLCIDFFAKSSVGLFSELKYMVDRGLNVGSELVPRLRVVTGEPGVEEAKDPEKDALVARAIALMDAYVLDCLSRTGDQSPISKTPKPRVVDGGERFLYAGETPEIIDYLGRLRLARIPCLELDPNRIKIVHASSKEAPSGNKMAVFSRYPVGVDGWERPKEELGVYKMNTINLCETFGIPHTQADLERARENGRKGYDVSVKGLGHFAVLLPRGKQNPLNLASLSEYPEDVFFALNQRINLLLRQHPEYARVRNGKVNGIPQFSDKDLERVLGG